MYEMYDSPLPDLAAVWERLGLTADEVRAADRATLDRLIWAWQTHIPFENLDAWRYHVPVSLEIPALFDKLITRRRGGYCFEMNGLFTRLLRDLGYQADSVFCRIVRGRSLEELPLCLHRGVIVTIDGQRYYCDVGYGGPQPPYAVELSIDKDRRKAQLARSQFRLEPWREHWWLLQRTTSEGGQEAVMLVSDLPQESAEFIPANFYCSANPASVFTQKPFFNLRTDRGYIGILGDQLTEERDGCKINQTIQAAEHLQTVLAGRFDLKVEL